MNIPKAADVRADVRTDEEVKTDLRDAIAMLMQAINKVEAENPGTRIKLMLAAEAPDGSGKIAARFDNADFIRDVARLVGYVEPTPEDRATFFLGRLGVKGVIREG